MSVLLKLIFLLGLLAVSPLLLFAMAIVFFEDGLPVIFTQKRIGKNKKLIDIYKIRTMQKSTPNKGTHEINNSNYLRVGFLLRNLKIDEIPQIINFLKGEINIVGPRPCLPNQYDLINHREKYNIYDVNPGITGLSQILGYDMSNPEVLAKVDGLYLKKKSFKLDLQIFLATFLTFYRKKIKIELIDELDKIKN